MKALPMWQPYASLVACGHKRIETRGFSPRRFGIHPGDRIAIYATKGTGPGGKAAYRERLALARQYLVHHHGVSTAQPEDAQLHDLAQALPYGQLIATCTLAVASRMTAAWVGRALEVNPVEADFGLYEPGRWAWMLTRTTRFAAPIEPPTKGSRQGAFEVPADALPSA